MCMMMARAREGRRLVSPGTRTVDSAEPVACSAGHVTSHCVHRQINLVSSRSRWHRQHFKLLIHAATHTRAKAAAVSQALHKNKRCL